MDNDCIDNIPDENIHIVSPKKCIFLLNKKNMFINSEKKRNNYEKYIQNIKYEKDNSIEDSENLKTIIKDPAIITSKMIIDIKSLRNSTNNINQKNNNKTKFQKKGKNIQLTIYKRVKNRDKNISTNISNDINHHKVKINIKYDKVKKSHINKNKININSNLTQPLTIDESNKSLKQSCKQTPKFSYTKNKAKEIINYKSLKMGKNQKSIGVTEQNKNKIFVKKLSKEYKSDSAKNSLSINKKDKRDIKNKNDNQKIITKKIAIKPEILTATKSIKIEKKHKIYMTQKDLTSNISEKNNILKNKDIANNNIIIANSKSLYLSKTKGSILKEKNIYKGKVFHIDYSHNQKRDLTSIIIGINTIKELIYKNLRKYFAKLKKICIYKKKIIYNIKTPKIKNSISQGKYKIYINTEYNKDTISREIENRIINTDTSARRKTYQTEHKFFSNDLDKMINNKTKTDFIDIKKRHNVLLLSPNSYINNCNINSVQINLFNNDYVNNNKKNIKNELIIKNISKKIKRLPNNNIEIIKSCKTSYNSNYYNNII